MPKITDAMIAEHKRCDEMYIKAEEAIASGDWEEAAKLASAFEKDMEQHFLMEETILFPAYVIKTKMSSVTDAMMMEHMQMRQLIFEIEESIKEKKQEHALGVGETLLTMMKQHNRKEERKLYVMADSALKTDADVLLNQMGMV